mmetsp:Transcript_12484/g.31456  ORF Transcript_12484/g.31456 Transcript_12484/m.31456 type:complete len:213 (-) Transcript_12484:3858-4496(-)
MARNSASSMSISRIHLCLTRSNTAACTESWLRIHSSTSSVWTWLCCIMARSSPLFGLATTANGAAASSSAAAARAPGPPPQCGQPPSKGGLAPRRAAPLGALPGVDAKLGRRRRGLPRAALLGVSDAPAASLERLSAASRAEATSTVSLPPPPPPSGATVSASIVADASSSPFVASSPSAKGIARAASPSASDVDRCGPAPPGAHPGNADNA